MDAASTAEQDEIRRTLRELLAKHSGPAEVRAAVATPEGYDTDLWHRMSGTLGLAGLALPEEYGGVGCGPAELAVALEETGRALAPSPLLATAVLTAPLIAALGSERQRAALLSRIAIGGLTCALAVPGGSLALALGLTGDNADDSWAGGGRAGGVQARTVEGRTLLYGEAAQVLDGHSAGLLLVAAHAGGFARSRTLLFLVRGDAAGLARVRLPTLDATRTQAAVQLRDVEGELLGEDPPNAPAGVLGALAATGRTAAVMLAAEAVGAAGAALDRTVEYTATREQFGRPVGSFQAVKHRLADLYVQVEAARSLVYCAAREAGPGGLALAAALEALRTVAGETIQLHGGIGFTWEHEAHLYFKRATADELLFGPARRLRAHAAAGLFGEVAA
ncbi:acyl-CoA dehydrogenase family protein [Streptomyces lateritius]|uniref:acyl-CoA dehydrogenase family protein n=1 Tax=Streptomyces lateritius TaxID=67313 RepID=UPI0016746DE7|nr:acyl-CoA dehydrogenase family protein [Streptomyces lateritius]GGU09138.1 acyl-CoA dehydrogenase [Streptomyces lateritius]